MSAIGSVHSLSNLKQVVILLHRRHGIYDRNKLSGLHKNSVFSKRYIISNVILMENTNDASKNGVSH